jgi:NAD(P)H-hydrate epimerase
MLTIDENENFVSGISEDLSKYTVIGAGPGLGTDQATQEVLETLIKKYSHPLVIDADGLNILSEKKKLVNSLPSFSILTPHPKEFERLFGPSKNDFERMKLAVAKAASLQVIIVLKGHYTLIATPDGRGYFNSTGNAGMAKGGSGDALTGIITGLLAQGYVPADACIFGVYLHGLAGDIAAAQFSEQSMLATDLIECLGKAFVQVSRS